MTACARGLAIACLIPALALAPACTQVTNPATGQTEFTAMSPEQEIAVGQEQHPQILQQFGGEYGDPELQAYVERIGEQLKAVSELPELDFTFTLLNSDVVNAFALPGGFVYISRGLLALAENEAEMAGVMAHEIGHVTARHSAQRYSRGVLAQGGVTIGTILAGIFLGGEAAQAVQQGGGLGAQAWLAGYSRDQEFQADELGVRYLSRAGYDPRAMSSFLAKLDANDQLARKLAGKAGQPDPGTSWFATHPRTPDRVARAIEQAMNQGGTGTKLERAAYLAQIDGMVFGDDPNQGFVVENEFVHPELRFAFRVPEGYQVQNTPAAVVAQSQERGAMKFDAAKVAAGREMVDYVAKDWARELKADRLRSVESFTLPDRLPGASGTVSGQLANGQQVELLLAAVRADSEQVYRFMFLHPGEAGEALLRADLATVKSFRRLSADEAASYQPKRIEVVTVAPGEDSADLAARMAVDALPREQFAVLNGLAADEEPAAGDQVKLVAQ